jgi:LmbE family N-acetylglucosaminyl deacetylase
MSFHGHTPRAAVIVAHPDDESLWCGGLILARRDWDWFVLTLCRRSDQDRALRFEGVLRYLGAKGAMADLDDGPDQHPLDHQLVRQTVLEQLPLREYDLVVTHGPEGEYTRHLRHEECSRAVTSLWIDGQLETREMKLFAYDDQKGKALPRVRTDAHEQITLDTDTFARKYHIMTNLYGFAHESWEARATNTSEGFYRAHTPSDLLDLRLARSAPETNK